MFEIKNMLIFSIIFGATIIIHASTNSFSSICSACNCAKTIIDCRNLNIYELFSTEEWKSINIKMEIIDLRFNYISNVTMFPGLAIKVLDLSHNQINWIEKRAFRNLTKIEFLDLSNNRLKSEMLTPDIFEGHFSAETYLSLTTLKELRLGNNNLHFLDPDLFEHLPALETLSLEYNPFKVIDRNSEMAISGIMALKSLDLSYMELNLLPIHIFHSPRALNRLNLTGNLFIEIPPALQFAINLKYLNLNENPIKDMTGTNHFMKMPALEVLSLSYMRMLKVIGSGSLSGLLNLKEIYANNNMQLSEIHQSAFSTIEKNASVTKWPPIKIIDIHSNNLSTIDSQLLGNWDALEVIDISSNPLKCDCENKWIFEILLLKIQKIAPKMIETLVCMFPPKFTGIRLMDFKTNNMRCMENNSEINNLSFGLLIGFFMGIPISLGLFMIHRRGCFGFLGKRGPADYSRAFYKQKVTDDMDI